MHLIAEFHGRRLLRVGEQAVVFVPVDERFLEGEEVGGQEDVGAEGGEEGVELC